ncbi:hypothetical protein CRG98_002987 [Punica granatum]|uniref:Uncharacterized protein n=1 Tax=Punica granatum TaxID=22663 RepID=A0A2I0L7J2_PUNGR|nr:hypothetical protein CRG98_002987 [Punica granatum]
MEVGNSLTGARRGIGEVLVDVRISADEAEGVVAVLAEPSGEILIHREGPALVFGRRMLHLRSLLLHPIRKLRAFMPNCLLAIANHFNPLFRGPVEGYSGRVEELIESDFEFSIGDKTDHTKNGPELMII